MEILICSPSPMKKFHRASCTAITRDSKNASIFLSSHHSVPQNSNLRCAPHVPPRENWPASDAPLFIRFMRCTRLNALFILLDFYPTTVKPNEGLCACYITYAPKWIIMYFHVTCCT